MNPLRQRTLTSCTQPVSLAHHEVNLLDIEIDVGDVVPLEEVIDHLRSPTDGTA